MSEEDDKFQNIIWDTGKVESDQSIHIEYQGPELKPRTSYNNRLQYQTYDVTDKLLKDNSAIGIVLGNGWYRGELGWQDGEYLYGDKLAALLQMHILYENGEEEVIISDSEWKSSTGPILMSEIYHGEIYDARLEAQGWSETDYDDENWTYVQELGHTKDILIAQENLPVRRMEEIQPIEIIHIPAEKR